MKKDRNSFFSQFGSYGYNNQPYMQPSMNVQPPAMPQVSSNMSYQMNQPAAVGSAYPIDDNIDARISKLEREINRMDARISKLEQTQSSINATNTDYNFANSMYMV